MSRPRFVARITPYEWLALSAVMQTANWSIDRTLLMNYLRSTIKHERPSDVVRSLVRGGFLESCDDNKHLAITTDGLRAKRNKHGKSVPWYVNVPPKLFTPDREE